MMMDMSRSFEVEDWEVTRPIMSKKKTTSDPMDWNGQVSTYRLTVKVVMIALCLLVGGWMLTRNRVGSATPMDKTMKIAMKDEQPSGLGIVVKTDFGVFSNMQFLGVGYNIYTGNPGTPTSGRGASLSDPGFTMRPIANLTAGTVLTPGGLYGIPKGTNVGSLVNCITQAASSQVEGEQSLFAELAQSVKLSTGYTGTMLNAAFTGSAEYKAQIDQIYKQKQTYMRATAKCAVYKATLLPSMVIESAFAQMVASLPLKAAPANRTDPYRHLIQQYGTHYTSQVVMGSMYTRMSEFSSSSMQQMSFSQIDVAATAEFEFASFVTGNANSGTATQRKDLQKFTQSRTNEFQITRGSKPPSDGLVSTWITDTNKTPYPIEFTLDMLSDVLTSHYFPNDPNIVTKSQILRNTILQWCTLPNSRCTTTARLKDRTISQNRVQSGQPSVTCPLSYTAISCGYDSHPGASAWKFYITPNAHIDPNNHHRCLCNNPARIPAKCYATCVPSNILVNFRLMKSPPQTIKRSVSCGGKGKVVGCGLINTHWAGWGFSVFANSATQSCECFTPFGSANCVGTCADNVIRSETAMSYGTGNPGPTITCSTPGNIALSCGIDLTVQRHGWEAWPDYYMSAYNACTAYGYFGVDAHILCGQFDTSHLPIAEKAKYKGQAVLRVTQDEMRVWEGSDAILE